MKQPESRLCIILYIFFIARENVLSLKTDAVCSNYDLLQNKPMTSDIVNENEIKFYDPLNDDTEFTKNTEININSIDFIRNDLTNYENIETDERAKIISSTEDGNVCLCGKTENLIENNKNDNLTHVYIAGMDDSLMELKRNIQKYGQGHELRVNFYLYKNQKCYDLGHLYTDAYVLRYFIPDCENYFCLDNTKNNWCLDNLSRKHYIEDFNRETASLKLNDKVENYNNQPIVAESKNLCNLIEYVPKEVAGHYEINIPKEQQNIEKNVLDDLNSNNFGIQNTNINSIIPQISLLEPEVLGSFKTVKNNNIDYADEENDVNTLNFVTGNKVYKQDINKLEEAINNKDYKTPNDITYNDNKKEYIIDINDSIDSTKNNELYKINENYLDYVPTNTISGKESDCNYVASPCSSEYRKEGDNDIVTSEKNYELLKIVHSYDENSLEQKEFGHNLQYDDGTSTKTYDKWFKTNDVFNYEPEIPNMLSTPRYIGGIKTNGNTLGMVKPLKLTCYPYQAYVIPNLQAKNMVCINKNDPEIEIVNRTFYNNVPILTRPQASVEQRNGNEFQGYIPTYDSENQIQSPPIPYEEATLNDNNLYNDVQTPIEQETYLKMPDIDNDDKRNYETSPKFNENQNKIPWYIKYIPNEANMWKNLPNIQKQLASDSLNTPREANKDELFTNLQSKPQIDKSLTPCINTNNYDISANSKIDFLEPQYEKERLYETKNMFPNTYNTDASEQEILSLKDNMNNVSPRTEYFMQDPCIYKNLKSLGGSGDSYYKPVTNYQNTNKQIIDITPYNSDLTKKTFKLKYYPYSVALVDTSVQDMGRGIASSISPNTINFKPIVDNTSDSILIPETNSVTTQDIKNPFNTLDQYTQNYKIPSRIVFTPLSYKIYPSKIVSPKPLTSNICHSNPYLGSNINNLNQPLTYKPVLYKNDAYENRQHNTPLSPTIVENLQSINRINDMSQKIPIQYSDNVVSNNLNINPFVTQNQNLQNPMYSVDPTTRNTVCFKKLSENEKPIVDEYQPSKSVTLDTSYGPFSNVANVRNADKSLNFNPKITISRDYLDPNIIGMPIKNSFEFTTTESKYPEIIEKTPFDVNRQESTGASSLRYKLLNPRPDTEILNSYINQTPQDEINIYNTNVQNMKTPAVTQYTVYPTSSLQNILISKPHNVMPTPYFQPIVTHSGISLQNGYASNLYRDKLEDNLLPNSISQVFPIGFNSKILSDRERLKFLKGQNINDFYNHNMQSILQETPIYQKPLQNSLNYETVLTRMPVKFSPYVGIPGYVEETNKLRNNKPNQRMINFKEIPVGTTAKDKGNYIIYNPTVKIDNLANTSPRYPMTSSGEDKILTPDYFNFRQDPLSKLYNVCERKLHYFNIPFQSGNYMQYSRKPQELLNTKPASSLTYYLPTAKLLPVKTSNINKSLLPVPTKVLLNRIIDIVEPSPTSNGEYSLLPNDKNFIPQLFLPNDRILAEATAYQSKITPVGNTYFNIPHTYDNLKDTYKNNLQTHKEKMLDGFYSTSSPKIRQEEILSLRNEDFIGYNKIGNEGKIQVYSQPYKRVSNYRKGPLQAIITPKIWSTNTLLPKNLVVENNEPNGDKITVPSIYNSYITGITPNTRKYNYILNKILNIPTVTTTESSLEAKLASQVSIPKINENGEIIQTEIPEENQGPITFGNIRYSKPKYQVKMTNNMHQGQDNIDILNAVPEFKQNYLENPSNLDKLNLYRSFNPRSTEREKSNNIFTANIEPSSYLQHNINPTYLTPYFSRYQKPSSINNVVNPFTVKPSLAQKQSVQDAFNQIVSSDDPNKSLIPKVYENLNYDIYPSGTQRITSLKQLSNLYYKPVDLRKSVNSVYDIETQQNNGYISHSSGNFNPISSSYIAEKDSYNTATTKNMYQYFNPTVMKINRQFNWPSKLINYMSPVESYKEQKTNMVMPSDSLTKTAQTSELPNTPNNELFGHDSGITPLINTFDWNVNLQRKEPPATSQYSSYTQYPNTFTSPFSYKSPEAYHPPIPFNADLNSHIYNDVSYSNIPRKSSSISPNVAEIISPKNNIIFFNVHNDLKQPINQYNKYISDEAGQNYYVNDNNKIATPNLKRFPMTPIMQHEKYPKHNYLFSKLHDSPQTVNMPSHVTYNSKSIPMQRSQGLFSNIDNPNYASSNLLYPKNIYSYSSSIPKESNQNLVNPLLRYKYLNKYFDNSSPTQILHSTTKSFSTVKTGEVSPVWNNLGTKNSLFTEYNLPPQYKPWKRLSLSEVNFNSIPKINSFSNISPITSTAPPAMSNRIFNKNDHVPLVHSDYNMITQNIGAFQSNAVPMLLPSNALQTKIESNPLAKSIISCTNVIPTNQPLSDFSSGFEPQRLISNKTSSEILKSNNDLVYPEQIYSEQGKITFLPKINSYCYDVKRTYLPIHSNEYKQNSLNEKDANIYTIEDNNYSDLYKIENQKYDILPSISQIEKQIPNYNYEKMKNPFLKSQFADLNYPFNLLTKPDLYNKFDKISSNINPYATFKPLRLYSPTYYQKQNINSPSFYPPYENSLSIQNHNLLNSVKTSPCTRSEHILFTPHVCKVFKPSTYPISTNEGAELHRSNLNTVYESQMISLPKHLSSSYIEPNRPIYKSIQYQNPAMYQSGNAIWSSDSEKYSNYKQTNSLPYIINYDLSQHIPFNPATTSNIPLQQAWKHNIQGFIKSQIKNFDQDNPLTKTCYQEENNSNEPLLSHTYGSNIMDTQNNMKYYQTLPKIVIAKYDPTAHKTFVIKSPDCDLKLKTWRSKLKVITPILVYKVKEIPTINFMPIRNTKYTTEEDMEKAKNYVAQKYGCPTIIKGVFSAYKPYAYINDSSALRDNMPVIWPTLCTCGCGRSGCRCRNK